MTTSKLQALVDEAQKMYKENVLKPTIYSDEEIANDAVTEVLCTLNRTSDILDLVACNVELMSYEGEREQVIELVSNLWDCTLTSTSPAIYLVYNIYYWILAQLLNKDMGELIEGEYK